MDLANPYSKTTCLILYLYSMELGTPPLYSVANRVSRDMDLTFLKELGPFLKVLSLITKNAEKEKDNDDKIMRGESIKGAVPYSLAGAFILYRGA